MNQVRAVFSDIELCAYLDGELPAERRSEVEAWLARQPEARAKLDGWRRQGHLLRASFGRIAQEPLPRQMTAALADPPVAGSKIAALPQPTPLRSVGRAIDPEPAMKAPPRPSRLRLAGLTILGVSGALALVISGAMRQSGGAPLAGWGETPTASLTAAGHGLTRHATEAHTAFAPRADRLIDVRSADPSVLTAAAAQAGLEARLPGAVAGLRTLGLRLTPADSGLGGLLMFDSEKNGRVSLFVARGGRGSAPGLVLRESNGLTVATFHVDGTSYALTGAAPRDQMVDWASALRLSLVQPRSLRGS